MDHEELLALIEKAENEGRLLEAFLVRSAYLDEVITTLTNACFANVAGLGGPGGEPFIETLHSNKKFSAFYYLIDKMDASRKIDILKDAGMLEEEAIQPLKGWLTNRRKIVHGLLRTSMGNKSFKKDISNIYDQLKLVCQATWFKRMEESLKEAEKELGLSQNTPLVT